jgi:hypothetical protein
MISKEEWKQHFLSVSEVMGVYECEHWNIVYFGNYWKIIGKAVGYEFRSMPNNDKTEYINLDILLDDLLMLETQTKILLQPKHRWVPESCPEVPWGTRPVIGIK